MLEVFRSIFIGAFQGISEFLPISSSGHLVLIPYIFKWDYQGLSFDVALHFGTAIAIVVYFWRDWARIVKSAFSFSRHPEPFSRHPERSEGSHNQIDSSAEPALSLSNGPQNDRSIYPKNLLWQILVASIPAAILGYLLNDYIETKLHSPLLIAFDLAFFGIILWLADKYSKKAIAPKEIGYKQTFFVGIAQAVALFPGVSRSGITITASRLLGLPREEAARFSFLLATPAILGAFLLKAKDIQANDLNLSFILGVLASTVFGLIAIKYLLKYLKKGDFIVFVWYRIIIAAIILTIVLAR